jgi:uncharacterized membrane protein
MTVGQLIPAPCQPKLHTLAALLAIVGLADSIYLWVKHLTGEDVTCIASSGCSEVLSSPYSTVGPIPLGAIGALGYFLAFSLALLTAFGNPRARTVLRILVAGMLATTLWLLYVQAFVLHAFCDFCLLSAALTLSISAIVTSGYFIERRHRAAGEQMPARQA